MSLLEVEQLFTCLRQQALAGRCPQMRDPHLILSYELYVGWSSIIIILVSRLTVGALPRLETTHERN